MIKFNISIDYDKIALTKQRLLKSLILKRAYKGYCAYVERGEGDNVPHSYEKFKEFEFWKIELAYRQYFAYIKGGSFADSLNCDRYNFRNLILNKL